RAVAADSTGNVVVAGSFLGTVDFGGQTFMSNSGWDTFLVKLDAAGNKLWAKQVGGLGQVGVWGRGIDANDNIVVGGELSGVADFGKGNVMSKDTDVLVAKFDTQGTLVWQKIAGVESNQGADAVAVDAKGDVYVAGYFMKGLDFGGGTLVD